MERSLPYSEHAEKAVLGACFLDREAIVPIAAWLLPEHFYSEKHATIYATIHDLYTAQTPPDLTTVADRLRSQGKLDRVGGVPYLIDLSNSVSTAYHVEHYAKTVERTAVLRRLIQAGGTIATLGFDETDDVEATLDAAERTLFDVRAGRGGQKSYVTLAQSLDTSYARIEAIQNGTFDGTGIKTRIMGIDGIIGGLGRGKMSVIAARPGVGKSAMAATILHNVAVAQGVPCGMFSLEMPHEDVTDRLISLHAEIDGELLRSGDLSDAELKRYVDAQAQLHSAPIVIDDSGELHISTLRSKARQMRTEHGIELLIVDYLQLIDGSRNRKQDGDVQEISYISKQLVGLARELNIHVIAVSQLSRAVEGRKDQRPILADLRGSGQIEQDAYLIMFLYRDDMVDKNSDRKGAAEAIIAKHRGGRLGTAHLVYRKEFTQFVDLSRYTAAEGY